MGRERWRLIATVLGLLLLFLAFVFGYLLRSELGWLFLAAGSVFVAIAIFSKGQLPGNGS
jgi:hypothetical protein